MFPSADSCPAVAGFRTVYNNDIMGKDIVAFPVAGPMSNRAQRCLNNPSCNAFNHNGWLKQVPKDPAYTRSSKYDFKSCVYIKGTLGCSIAPAAG